MNTANGDAIGSSISRSRSGNPDKLKYLTGFIEHKLEFVDDDTTAVKHARKEGRKRKHTCNKSISTSSNKVVQNAREEDKEEIHCEDNTRRKNNSVGFFFTEISALGEHGNAGSGGGSDCLGSCLPPYRCTRIIVPQMMLKLVCDCVRFHRPVVLCKYTVVTLVDENSEGSNARSERSSEDAMELIELHQNGLLIHHSQTLSCSSSASSSSFIDADLEFQRIHDHPTTASISLTETQKLEENMESERQKSKYEKGPTVASKKAISSKYFNIHGKVDAISPIISAVPTDPFALIELYDEENPSMSAVIILKGIDALTCQPGILPGNKVTFSNVLRSKWHVPQSFRRANANVPRRLHFRAPSHVFVVTDCKSIKWEQPSISTVYNSIRDNCIHQSPFNQCIGNAKISRPIVTACPLPSTIHQLCSVQGKVVAVQYSYVKIPTDRKIANDNGTSRTNNRNSWYPRHINYIVVEEDNGPYSRKMRNKLYLLYYPMSPDVYFGLSIGSFVRAMNIHRIVIPYLQPHGRSRQPLRNDDHNYLCFGACLRSTITILAHSSDKHLLNYGWNGYYQVDCDDGDEILRDNESTAIAQGDTRRLINSSIISQKQFYVLNNIKTNYIEREWISQVKSHAFKGLDCISDIHIHNTLQICIARNRKEAINDYEHFHYSNRDPYKEWFDHCCENEENEKKICHCPSTPLPQEFFPTLMNLLHIRSVCMGKMQNELRNIQIFQNGSSGSHTPVRVGWSASMVFNNSQLHQLLLSRAQKSNIQLGGIIDRSNGTIHDGICQLPLIPVAKHGDSSQSYRSLSHADNFMIVGIQNIIVSSFYLGKNGGTIGSEDGDWTKTCPLPPLLPRESSITVGACDLSSFGGHLFINSIQIQYYEDQIITATESNVCSHSIGPHSQQVYDDNNNSRLRKRLDEVYPLTKYICNHTVWNKNDEEKSFVGRLTFLYWRAYRLRNYMFKGCLLTLSSVPIRREMEETVVSNQSIDLKLSIPIPDDVMSKTATAINTFSSSKLTQEQLSFASAWRTLAEESRLCPIVISQNGFCKIFQTDIVVRGNESALEKKEVSIDAIQVIVKEFPGNRYQVENDPSIIIAGGRRLEGTLQPFHKRRSIQSREQKSYGEYTLSAKSFHGVPTLNISALMYRLLNSMTTKCPGTQLVWRIPGARVIKLNFCSVRIECTSCFKNFVNKHEDNLIHEDRHEGYNRMSFWDKPLPIRFNAKHTKQTEAAKKNSNDECLLSCPSGCGCHYGAPKWELSGIVDDGTGTAKLYAERDAAIMVLGKGVDVQLIEKAAWSSSDGITFQRGVRLDDAIKNKIQKVHRFSSCERRGLVINDLIDMRSKGIIELYQHCLESKEMQRRLDFLCRCKQLSKGKFIMNPVDMHVASALGLGGKAIYSNVGSFRAPALELKLVDAIRPLEQPSEMGWSIITSVL